MLLEFGGIAVFDLLGLRMRSSKLYFINSNIAWIFLALNNSSKKYKTKAESLLYPYSLMTEHIFSG